MNGLAKQHPQIGIDHTFDQRWDLIAEVAGEIPSSKQLVGQSSIARDRSSWLAFGDQGTLYRSPVVSTEAARLVFAFCLLREDGIGLKQSSRIERTKARKPNASSERACSRPQTKVCSWQHEIHAACIYGDFVVFVATLSADEATSDRVLHRPRATGYGLRFPVLQRYCFVGVVGDAQELEQLPALFRCDVYSAAPTVSTQQQRVDGCAPNQEAIGGNASRIGYTRAAEVVG